MYCLLFFGVYGSAFSCFLLKKLAAAVRSLDCHISSQETQTIIVLVYGSAFNSLQFFSFPPFFFPFFLPCLMHMIVALNFCFCYFALRSWCSLGFIVLSGQVASASCLQDFLLLCLPDRFAVKMLNL